MEYMEKMLTSLKEIIDREGEEFLTVSPFEVYRELEKKKVGSVERRTVLCTLLAGIPKKAKECRDTGALSGTIQRSCCFRKNVSDRLAEMYVALYSTENQSAWNEQHEQGFRDFCQKSWTFQWEGYATWHTDGGHIDRSASAEYELRVMDQDVFRKQVAERLQSNPFTTAEWMFKHMEQVLNKYLQDDLDEYVDDDDYDPPVMEDYWDNSQEDFGEYCRKLGFEVISFDGDADMDDFEPDFRGRRG